MSHSPSCNSSSFGNFDHLGKSSLENPIRLDDSDGEDAETTKYSAVTVATSDPNEICRRLMCCRICGEEFGTKAALVLHLRDKHSVGDKFYKCGSCYKSFPSSQQLTQHMLVHTNVRRYQCQFCDKAFKQLSHVQQHERIHTGELPYHCPVSSCDRSFRQLSSMKQHLKGHGQYVAPSNVSSASSSSPFSEPNFNFISSPKVKIERSSHYDLLSNVTTSLQYHVPDSSCGAVASVPTIACSSESENSIGSSHVNDEEPVPARKLHKETGTLTPLYQQSLIDLSSKLGEIKRRQRRLRLRAAIAP